MPLFSSCSFFRGSNEAVYVDVARTVSPARLLLSGFGWCILRSVCSGMSLWWWRCLDVRVGPFFSFPWQASRLLVVRGPSVLKWFDVGLLSLSLFCHKIDEWLGVTWDVCRFQVFLSQDHTSSVLFTGISGRMANKCFDGLVVSIKWLKSCSLGLFPNTLGKMTEQPLIAMFGMLACGVVSCYFKVGKCCCRVEWKTK